MKFSKILGIAKDAIWLLFMSPLLVPAINHFFLPHVLLVQKLSYTNLQKMQTMYDDKILCYNLINVGHKNIIGDGSQNGKVLCDTCLVLYIDNVDNSISVDYVNIKQTNRQINQAIWSWDKNKIYCRFHNLRPDDILSITISFTSNGDNPNCLLKIDEACFHEKTSIKVKNDDITMRTLVLPLYFWESILMMGALFICSTYIVLRKLKKRILKNKIKL